MDIDALKRKQAIMKNSSKKTEETTHAIDNNNTKPLSIKCMKENNERLRESVEDTKIELNKVAKSYRNLAEVTRNIDQILTDLEQEIDKLTGLNRRDIAFLMFATSLQCIRQYCFTNFKEPLSDQEAAKLTKGHNAEHSYRNGKLYHPTLEMIITSPVPYDAMIGSGKFNLGLNGKNHRVKTLGHDPVLGWVFGTMNILTSTITNNKFDSYHVRTENKRDLIKYKADLGLIIKYSAERLKHEQECVAAALFKQYVHLCSDMPTKKSLPIPIVSTLSEELALEIANRGINLATSINVGKQAAGASLINSIIASIHGLCNDENIPSNLYEVKTRKILLYSNAIATTSNVIYTAMNVYSGNTSALSKFDIGGFVVTLYRLFNDKSFIRQVEEEFLRNEIYKIIIEC